MSIMSAKCYAVMVTPEQCFLNLHIYNNECDNTSISLNLPKGFQHILLTFTNAFQFGICGRTIKEGET